MTLTHLDEQGHVVQRGEVVHIVAEFIPQME